MEDSIPMVVSRMTHELIVNDMPSFPVPRRTLFGRYNYGQIPKVVVDLVIDKLEDLIVSMEHPPRKLKNDLVALRVSRHYDPRIL